MNFGDSMQSQDNNNNVEKIKEDDEEYNYGDSYFRSQIRSTNYRKKTGSM